MSKEAKSDTVLAYCLLKQDLFFSKIPADEVPRYVQTALDAGAEAAAEHAHQSVKDWYEQYQIKIVYKDRGAAFGGTEFRAQIDYTGKEPHIVLYRQALDRLSQVCPDVETAILGHELFHYLEVTRKRHVSDQLPPVVTFRLGPLQRKAAIQTASEIAAHKFSKDLGGLPYLGNYYDYLYLVQTGKLQSQTLKASLKVLAQEYQSLCGEGTHPPTESEVRNGSRER